MSASSIAASGAGPMPANSTIFTSESGPMAGNPLMQTGPSLRAMRRSGKPRRQIAASLPAEQAAASTLAFAASTLAFAA